MNLEVIIEKLNSLNYREIRKRDIEKLEKEMNNGGYFINMLTKRCLKNREIKGVRKATFTKAYIYSLISCREEEENEVKRFVKEMLEGSSKNSNNKELLTILQSYDKKETTERIIDLVDELDISNYESNVIYMFDKVENEYLVNFFKSKILKIMGIPTISSSIEKLKFIVLYRYLQYRDNAVMFKGLDKDLIDYLKLIGDIREENKEPSKKLIDILKV